MEYQHIWVKFNSSGLSAGESPPDRRISIKENSTYRAIQNKINEAEPDQWVLLQAHYGPEPYWTASNLDSPIPPVFQTLHAVKTDDRPYSIAVVKGTQTDYPLVIFDLPTRSSTVVSQVTSLISRASSSSLFNPFSAPDDKDPSNFPDHEGRTHSVYSMVASAGPDLRIKSITTRYSFSAPDVQAEPYSVYQEMKNKGEVPRFFVHLRDSDRPASFQLDTLPNSTPPSLQTLVVNCKDLLQRSYSLRFFFLEMIHVSSALLHVINHLGEWLSSRRYKYTLQARDERQFGLLLAENLEKCLDELKVIVEHGEGDNFDPVEIPRKTTWILNELCGEYPGAVAIRDSYTTLEEFKAIDEMEARKSDPTSVAAIPSQLTLASHGDTRARIAKSPVVTDTITLMAGSGLDSDVPRAAIGNHISPPFVAMSNNEDKSLLEQLDDIAPLRQFDAFPKIPANYKSRTKFGGFMTIFVVALSFLLVLNDIAEFIWGWSDYEFAVDTDNHRALDINVDIIVNSPCSTLSVDLRDAVGDRLHLSDTFRRDGTLFDVSQAHDFKEHQRKISTREVVAASRRSRGFFSLFKASRLQFRPTYNHVPDGSACRVYGSISVRKLTGNFHITTFGHGYETQGMGHTDHKNINMSHIITEFSFGPYFPEITQPLDYSFETTDQPLVAFQYFLTVVPTTYVAPRSRPLHTYQYSVTHYVKQLEHSRGTPGIFFKYDIDPLALEVHQRTTSLTQFLVRIVGVIGGVWVCFGWGLKVASKVSQKAGITGEDKEPIVQVIRKKRRGGYSLNLHRRAKGDDYHGNGSPWSTPMGTPSPYGFFSDQGTPANPYGSFPVHMDLDAL